MTKHTDKNKMNAQVTVTSVTQSANEVLGKKESKLYYLIIKTPKGQTTINVGEKTYKNVDELTNGTTKLQFEEDQSTTKLTPEQLKGGKK